VIDPSGVYFRREGKGGQFICGVSPQEQNDVDCDDDATLDMPQHELFEEVIWPTIAARVPAFEQLKLHNAWAGYYDYNTFDQVRMFCLSCHVIDVCLECNHRTRSSSIQFIPD
jgi:FAD-dependent oxidoreductase domain-containing protein 1